jgi:nodulation protein E
MNRVAITGIGCVSPLGLDTGAMAARLSRGISAIGPLTLLPTDNLIVKIGAEVPGFDPSAHFEPRPLSQIDRTVQLGVVAAREAVASSGLDFHGALGERTAAIIGCGVGGMNTLDEAFHRLYAEGARRLAPITIPKLMFNAVTSHITMDQGIKGPAFTVASACASANHAIGTAFRMVRDGAVEAALTGGAESVFTYGTLKGWEAMRILAPDTCRPFSQGRKGLVLGEGAGMVVLENLERAKARGARIFGEMLGCGMSSDAGDIIFPSVDGAVAAIAACLGESGLAPEAVDYINAHGTGTTANDVTETRAIRAVFGAHAGRLAVSSTKSLHGHSLGAAGAVEFIATLLAMEAGFIPPTANFLGPDPECDLDYVPNAPRPGQIEVALSNSFAFGGLNAVIAFRRGTAGFPAR